MTKKQKEKLIIELKKVVSDNGFSIDRFGHYVKENKTEKFRAKFMDINLRFEVKRNTKGAQWFKIVSTPIVKIDPVLFSERLKIRTREL